LGKKTWGNIQALKTNLIRFEIISY